MKKIKSPPLNLKYTEELKAFLRLVVQIPEAKKIKGFEKSSKYMQK